MLTGHLVQLGSLDQEDPLEKGMASHSSILVWRKHGQRKLVGYRLQDHKDWNMTEATAHMYFMLIFLLEVLIPVCEPSILAFCMMYSAYKLNKQEVVIPDIRQP